MYDQAHVKTYNKTFMTSEDSDQPAHSRSLIRVFADSMYLLRPPGYPKRVNENLWHWADVRSDLSLCWSHRSYCRLAYIQMYHDVSGANKLWKYLRYGPS